MILFSFEVDTLEIALREQQDMVDTIFLVESSLSHKGVTKLMFKTCQATFFLESQAFDVGKAKTDKEV